MVSGKCRLILVLGIAISICGLTQSSDAKVIPNAYIVQVADTVDAHEAAGKAARFTGGSIGHVYSKALRGFSIRVPPGVTDAQILAQPGVILVEPDLEVTLCAQTLPTGVNRIDVDLNNTAKIDGIDERVDVDIAIIDTGIDGDHPDLNVYTGQNFSTGNRSAWDDGHGHGTHVAGITAALDNGIGVVGVAPGARLWAVKVLKDAGVSFVSNVIAGVDWVTENADQIEVVNMSLGATGTSDAFRTAIQNSVAAGIVYVVAAGNDARDVYGSDGTFNTSDDIIPAAYPEAAAISAMADSDGRPGGAGSSTGYGGDDSFATFSNFSRSVVAGNPATSPGAAIDLLMPGVNIYSAWKNGGYNTISGTSMASPHAAGLVALYIAVNGRATSAAGVYAIRQALIDGGAAQNSAQGLALLNDPDANLENIGWAGMETISGHITEPDGNTPVVNVLVDANNNGGSSDITDANGYYEVTVPYNWTGNVTPIKEGYTFEPNSISYSNVTSDQVNQDYVATLLVRPEITSIPITTAAVGRLYSYDVNATGVPVPAYSLTASPNNMDINSVTGLIEWIPEVNQIGDVNITVEAVNTAGSGTQNFTVAVSLVDDFNDNRRSAMWRLSADDYNKARVFEGANRLQFSSVGDVNGLVALYTANGWRFDVNENFALEADFHYSGISDEKGWVGIIVENEESYVSISAGSDGNEPYFYYETIFDGNTVLEKEPRDSNDGTLYISYNADSNNLYLSHLGYGSENAYIWQMIPSPLNCQWTSPVKAAIGGGSDAVAVGTGEAYLDDFGVAVATVPGWPPVNDFDNNGFIEWLDVAVIAENWLTNGEGDINGDDIVDFLDFAEFGLAW